MSGAMPPPNPSSSTERRYALVVGVNDAPNITHLPLLKSAEDNAISVANVLQERCNCTLLREPLLGADATTDAVRQALKTLTQRRTDDDLLIFYFAGHGFIHEDRERQRPVYLVTYDLDVDLVAEGEDLDSISLDLLHKWLYETTKAGRVLILLDCCYAGNMGRIPSDLPLNTIFDLFKRYLGATNTAMLGKYRVTIAATGHDTEAWENDNAMTQHLVAALRGERPDARNEQGEVTIGRLYDTLYQIMPAKQKPSFSGDTAGRGLILATYPEYSAQARQAQQQAQRREHLQILSAAPDGERFLRDRLESFVGRETELHAIQQSITTVQPSGGYITITGQAGQGKSSLISALIAQYAPTTEERERIPFHFIPFNPGPEYQVTLLHNLMARLILKYDLSDLYIASDSRHALRDFFPKVLREVAAKGGQEMIFIDGLDQIESDLNGVRDLSFLPTNPPEGIVFVLGTRPDDTLKPLTLLKPTQSYQLPPLSREDFSMLLQRRQVPPLERGLADQFYEKMQQNALYLDLLARELHNQGPITPDAIDTIIHRLAEDPDNIFSLALERLEHREDWREVIKPLLGVLLVAYEPLTPWQLRTILTLDHRQVQNGLQSLSGLVTHIEQRYALYHLKFQDFLRQDEARPDKPSLFATNDEAGYHARLVQWCERDQLSIIWKDTRDSSEQSRRVYVRHHYISHLYASRLWERLFAVLDEQSYGKAKERYDVGARSYIQDLKKGCLAVTWDGWTDAQHLKYLSRLWRYTLLRCSIQSTADQYPLDLFKVMLILGKEREVAGLIELITNPYKKVETLLLFAQYLVQSPERKQESAALYLRVEEVARSIQDASGHAKALRALATALAQAQQWKQAEEIAHSIQDAYEHAKALTALATALAQTQQWKQAEEVARSIQDAFLQAEALTALATALAQAQQWKQAEEVARSIQGASGQTEALTALATALAQAQQWKQAEEVARSIQDAFLQAMALTVITTALAQVQQWKQAEEVAHSIQGASRQAEALTVIAIALAQAQQWESAKRLLSQVVEVARSIQYASLQAEALTALAIALAQAQQWEIAKRPLSQVVEVARSIEDASLQAKALTALATALAQAQQWESAKRLLSQAVEVVHSIEDDSLQAKALTALATALAQAQQWKQAEKVARSIQDAYWQTKVLTALATALAQAQQWKQAEEVARSIQDAREQAKALTALATALAQAQQWESAKWLLSQAEEVVHSIQDDSLQAEALTALATSLATALAQAQQWKQAEEVARSMQDASGQAEALTALATALAQAQQWKQAEKVVRSMQGAYGHAEALTALAIALAQAQQWKQAEKVARSIQGTREQAKALTALAIALAQAQQWKQAEKVARSMQGASGQAKALTALATALAQAQQWKQAEKVARSIQGAYWHAEALTVIAIVLSQAQQWESAKRLLSQAEEVVHSIEDASGQAEALTALATALAQAQQWESAKRLLSQAVEVVHSIEDDSLQAKALTALATALAQVQQWKQAEKVARSIQGASGQAKALTALATALAQAQQWKQAEEVAHSIQDAHGQTEALTALATALAQAQQWKQAEEVARSMQGTYGQTEALTALATALAQAQQWKQAEEVAHSIQDASEQTEALTALATALTKQEHYSHLISFVQRSWQHAETRDEALRLLPLAFGLITQTPALGMELYAAFQWVNDFLAGS